MAALHREVDVAQHLEAGPITESMPRHSTAYSGSGTLLAPRPRFHREVAEEAASTGASGGLAAAAPAPRLPRAPGAA